MRVRKHRQKKTLSVEQQVMGIMATSMPIRELVAKMARSAAKDAVAEQLEAKREQYEADPLFERWAQQQRETQLADETNEKARALFALVQERAKDLEAEPLAPPLQGKLLRHAVLGLLAQRGPMTMNLIVLEFDEYDDKQVESRLYDLIAMGLVRPDANGFYGAVAAQTSTYKLEDK